MMVSGTASIDRELLTELRERLHAGGEAELLVLAQGHGVQRKILFRPESLGGKNICGRLQRFGITHDERFVFKDI